MDTPPEATKSFRLGLGTGHLRDDEECEKAVQRGLELGYRHIDTARAYNNERAIGRAIKQADVDSDDVFVATKIHSRNLGSSDVIEAIRSSREALGVDTIDLVYVHWPAHAYDSTETLSTLSSARSSGLIRHIGLSNFTEDLITEARDNIECPIFAVQAEMHPYLQQQSLLEYARDRDIWFVAHTPLAQGHVLDDPVINSIANKHNISNAQVVLGWLLNQEGVVAIPSGSAEHLKENFGVMTNALDTEDMRQIDDLDKQSRFVDYEFSPWNNSDHGCI